MASPAGLRASRFFFFWQTLHTVVSMSVSAGGAMGKFLRTLLGDIGRGFRSFTLCPGTQMPDLRGQHSDADAMQSNWKKVGDDLRTAADCFKDVKR
jgi:hypothetical protein